MVQKCCYIYSKTSRIWSNYTFKDILCFTLVVNIVLCTRLNLTKVHITSTTALHKTYESYNKPYNTWIMINKAWALGISSFKWLNICSERVSMLDFIFYVMGFVLIRENNYILCFSTRPRLFKSHVCHLLNLQRLSELHPCHENMIWRQAATL